MDFSSQFEGVNYSFLPAETNGTKYHRLLAESGGKSVGHLDWHPGNNTIHSVQVDESLRGRGLATDMARNVADNMPVYPNGRKAQLSHSDNRSPDGERFAQKTRDFTYVPPNKNIPRKRTRAKYQAEDF